MGQEGEGGFSVNGLPIRPHYFVRTDLNAGGAVLGHLSYRDSAVGGCTN